MDFATTPSTLPGRLSPFDSTRLAEELAKEQPSASTIVEALIEQGASLGASDIHLDPQRMHVRVRVRIDGMLQDTQHIPLSCHQALISRIKILSGLRTDEHQAAQDGRFRFVRSESDPIDVRVSIAPTYHGENAVLRLLAPLSEAFSLESLGLTKEHAATIRRALSKPSGMILATGPTGSGKTSTLYTLIRQIISKDISIVTIEDPIEYSIDGINQIHAREHAGLSFAQGLRSILRQDPDVIMVGEIRDTETAGLAVNAALTGHLVLSTLHTNDATAALPRLLDMKVEPYLIASTVSLVIAQRLVRRVCSACSTTVPFSKISHMYGEELREHLPPNGTYRKATGCSACAHTGYVGRTGIYELLPLDATIRTAVAQKNTADDIRSIAIAQGMVPMIADGFMKAAAGITTIEEVLRTNHE